MNFSFRVPIRFGLVRVTSSYFIYLYFTTPLAQVLSGWLRPHAQIQLSTEDAWKGGDNKNKNKEEEVPKTMARKWFEISHKSMGRLAPIVALLAILR
jgi:hypothetical protein